MKCITRLFVFFVLALGLSATTGQAQTQTGTVTGTVMDQQGAVLPGATVVLTGPRGSLDSVTDGRGEFRFVGVAPGTYVLKAELSGFLPQQRGDVTVGMGKTIATEFTLKVGGMTETVEVSGSASTVDVKSSATDTTLSNDLLQLTPIYSSTSTGLLNYAPGINSSSAFGGQGSYGNALLLDGVDTRDPEGGSAWTFFNQNLIEEIQIGGLGAPAEYGGFTGAIINTVTKSGGNAFSGLFSMRYTNDSLAGDNISQALLAQNSNLGNASITKKLTDYYGPDGRAAQEGQGVLLRQHPALFGADRPGGPRRERDRRQSPVQRQGDAAADDEGHDRARHAVRLVQRDRAGRLLAHLAGHRQPDGQRGCAGVGVERAVAPHLRDQRAARVEGHGVHRLLQSGPGRSVAVHLRRRYAAPTAAAAAGSTTPIATATWCRCP